MDDNTLLLEFPRAGRAGPVQSLLDRYHALRAYATRARLSIALSASRFIACQGPGWMCCSSRADYAREHLGMPPRTFDAYVRAGDLLWLLPVARSAVLEGCVGWSGLLELTRLPTVDHARTVLELACGQSAREVRSLVDRLLSAADGAETPALGPDPASDSDRRACAPGGDPHRGPATTEHALLLDPLAEARYQPLTLRLPPEVALYADETLELARAVVGFEAPDDIALSAVVAEASERIDVTVTGQDACRRFGVSALEGPAATPLAAPARVRPASRLRSLAEARPLPSVTSTSPGSVPTANRAAIWRLDSRHPTQREAHILDRRLRRLVGRLQQAQVHMEDELLHLLLDGAPARLGYPGLECMAGDLLDLPASTTWDYIRRARRRRRDHPVAVARAQGQLTDVKADLLEQLQAQAHVPPSALPPWILRAQRVTVRKLRDTLTWARRQTYTDARGWANAGYPPPDDQQLRTSSRLIEDIASDPTPPDPVPLLLQADHVRTVTVRWVLESGTLVALAQLMASVQDRIQSDHRRNTGELCSRPSAWWALLAVLVLARRGWAPLAAQKDYRSHPILSRERFRCAAPDCTLRRGLEDHHLDYRGRGGCNKRWNRACLCAFHHRLGEHGGILRVRGAAKPDAGSLRWQMALDPRGRPTRVIRGDDILYDARTPRPPVAATAQRT